MKKAFSITIACLLLLAPAPRAFCADAKAEFQTLAAQIKTKLQAGHRTEADLTDELKQFDTLLAEHKGEKTDDVANILFMKGLLYEQVFSNDAKAIEILQQVKTDFPDTADGKKVDMVLASLAAQADAKKVSNGLVEGAAFPDLNVKDLNGEPLDLSAHKGKLVLIDFWATWCGPCVRELPNVVAAYGKYHDKGFDIIGVSLDKDKDKLLAFTKDKNMTWPQYFDGKGWENVLATRYGIQSIPATFLIGKDGKIIGKDLRGEALDTALSAALAAK